MRDYAKVSPAFWMTGSGKALRCHPEAQIVGLYLVTCPSANMIGLYYLPMALLVHETGLSPEGASKGLARASEAGFAFYDEAAELIWVPNGANYQIGETLSGKDKRKEGVLRELHVFRKHPFAREFFDRYRVPFGLREPDWLMARSEAPSKPLRSQDQEHAQEQEQDHEREPARVFRNSEPRAPEAVMLPLPADFRLTDERRGYAEIGGLTDIDAAFRKFLNLCAERAKTSADWDATWRKFCDGELVYQRRDRERGRPLAGGRAPDAPNRSPTLVPIQPLRRPRREATRG